MQRRRLALVQIKPVKLSHVGWFSERDGKGDPLTIISHFFDEYDLNHDPQLPEANPPDVFRMFVEERSMTGKGPQRKGSDAERPNQQDEVLRRIKWSGR